MREIPRATSSPIQTDITVWQNTEAGEGLEEHGASHWRSFDLCSTACPWKLVLQLRGAYPYAWPALFAADLVPRDMESMTKGLLTDPIEDALVGRITTCSVGEWSWRPGHGRTSRCTANSSRYR